MDNILPLLTSLKLGRNFERLVDYLTNSITFLDLGACFNQELCRLPASRTDLVASNLDLRHEIHSPPPHLTALSTHVYENYEKK